MTQADQNLLHHLLEAEHKAIDSLARYKFQMFGYWAAIWVHLNRIGDFKRQSPFREFVAAAKLTQKGEPGVKFELATVIEERDMLRDDLNSLEKACSYCAQPEDFGDPERHYHEPEGWHWHHYLDPGDGLPSPCANSELFERLLKDLIPEGRPGIL